MITFKVNTKVVHIPNGVYDIELFLYEGLVCDGLCLRNSGIFLDKLNPSSRSQLIDFRHVPKHRFQMISHMIKIIREVPND